MTAAEFRRMALSFEGAEEREHMGHPDFRVSGKIFATMGYPDKSCAVVKLTPEQQHESNLAEPDVFVPVSGGWGKKGATTVRLKAAKKGTVLKALEAAWRNTAGKKIVRTQNDLTARAI
jgi:hypothetical protein